MANHQLSFFFHFRDENPVSDYAVVMGDVDNSMKEGNEVKIAVEKYIIHPLYNNVTTDFDATLLKLEAPVQV